jgi:hypothetical protein
MPTSSSSRRAFIKTMGVVAAAATCSPTAPAKAQDYKPQDQKKLTQAAADHPNGNESCASCPYFILPKNCVLVEGEISPNGWCPIYTTFWADIGSRDGASVELERCPLRKSTASYLIATIRPMHL